MLKHAYKIRNYLFRRNLYLCAIFKPLIEIFTFKRIKYILRWKIVGEIEEDFRQKLDTGVQELTRRRRRQSSTKRPVVLPLLL